MKRGLSLLLVFTLLFACIPAAHAAPADAVLLRDVINGTYYAYRIFHAGMATPVPVANGGTGASSAKAALNSLGIFYAATLPSTGTDGQICLVPL